MFTPLRDRTREFDYVLDELDPSTARVRRRKLSEAAAACFVVAFSGFSIHYPSRMKWLNFDCCDGRVVLNRSYSDSWDWAREAIMSDYIRIYRGFKISVSCVELSPRRYAVEWAVTPNTDETRDQMKSERIHIDAREELHGRQEEVLGHAYELAERFVDGVISRAHDVKG